jgi:pyruvate dehydrogenase E2 component (dihydrolipoamide acetyltransferase)
MRRTIAGRMLQSRQTTAPVTLNTEVDATAFVALRAQAKTAYATRNLPAPTYNDLLVKLVSIALRDHPGLNATWEDDALLHWETINIGLAVDTDAGLLVPVVRDVQDKSVARIAAESRELIARAQAGKATIADMQGGTFTISNLGMFGIDAFTPVINLPECAILGVGRMIDKPVVREGAIVVRSMMTLSLTFDHRTVDGAPAARFLQQVGEFIEEPTLWLME